ncbi:GerMN domain-containing protein [Blastococcus capsensis]|uniref:GerMN domain-containing protein n=1 Tax=Blastococcus capsensis TaxID=1564163 RepID=UPI002540931F|nr:GerMN domain-containing protein [Blastococcus capsensis]MDK3257659.1 GerMN domain-containing protein [Blastococcus capsensis]
MRAFLALLCGLVVLTGCGVEPQTAPQPLTIPAPQPSQPGQRTDDVGLELTVFFVRGTDLMPARRSVDAPTAAEALEALTAGPTRADVIVGLRTALAPQPLSVDVGLPGGITSVTVTPEFAGISGGNQLLAVAQVVWTLTGLEDTQQVRFLVDGVPVEVPTDTGLTEAPVGRDNFSSVAPPQSPEPAPR